ncbi:hypothetical protein ACOMHN_011191 [Nucella lapillus]
MSYKNRAAELKAQGNEMKTVGELAVKRVGGVYVGNIGDGLIAFLLEVSRLPLGNHIDGKVSGAVEELKHSFGAQCWNLAAPGKLGVKGMGPDHWHLTGKRGGGVIVIEDVWRGLERVLCVLGPQPLSLSVCWRGEGGYHPLAAVSLLAK